MPKHIPKPDRRRALELFAGSRDGCTEAIMLALGFTVDMLVEMVNAGFATAKAERVVAGLAEPHEPRGEWGRVCHSRRWT